MSRKVLSDVVRVAATRAGIDELAPDDLWRTCDRLVTWRLGTRADPLSVGPRLRPTTEAIFTFPYCRASGERLEPLSLRQRRQAPLAAR